MLEFSARVISIRLFDLLLLILKRKSVVRITTGSQALDELLGGNICRP